MGTFLSVLIIIICVLLILIVLVQNPKGGGLSAGFSSTNQVMGVRKTADFLEKATWTLAIALVVFCLVAGLTTGTTSAVQDTELRGKINETSTPAPAPANAPAPGSTAPSPTNTPAPSAPPAGQ